MLETLVNSEEGEPPADSSYDSKEKLYKQMKDNYKKIKGNCPLCGGQIYQGTEKCSNCGHNFSRKIEK